MRLACRLLRISRFECIVDIYQLLKKEEPKIPNWCCNSAKLTHSDPAMIDRVVRSFREGRLLNEFVPMPPELLIDDVLNPSAEQEAVYKENETKFGFSSWYDWALARWGTKWDVGSEGDSLDRVDSNTVQLSFESAWSPPIEFYDELIRLGFDVKAYYFEPGQGFCGRYETGSGDVYYEIEEFSADWIEENIPRDIDEAMGISDFAASFS